MRPKLRSHIYDLRIGLLIAEDMCYTELFRGRPSALDVNKARNNWKSRERREKQRWLITKVRLSLVHLLKTGFAAILANKFAMCEGWPWFFRCWSRQGRSVGFSASPIRAAPGENADNADSLLLHRKNRVPRNFAARARKTRKIRNADGRNSETANAVSESTVSNTELSEFFCALRAPGRQLSEFISAYFLCAKANSPRFAQNSPSLPRNLVSSLFQNSTLAKQYPARFLETRKIRRALQGTLLSS